MIDLLDRFVCRVHAMLCQFFSVCFCVLGFCLFFSYSKFRCCCHDINLVPTHRFVAFVFLQLPAVLVSQNHQSIRTSSCSLALEACRV